MILVSVFNQHKHMLHGLKLALIKQIQLLPCPAYSLMTDCLLHCFMAIQKILCKPHLDCTNAFKHPVITRLFT